jgi:hypothetical protein
MSTAAFTILYDGWLLAQNRVTTQSAYRLSSLIKQPLQLKLVPVRH